MIRVIGVLVGIGVRSDNSSGSSSSRNSNRNTNRSNNDRRRNDSQKVMDMNVVVKHCVICICQGWGMEISMSIIR